jgi:MFS family permease
MPASFAVGWRQVGSCFLLLSASGMVASTYSLVAVPLAQEFQPSRMVLMLSMTVMAAATAVLMPLIGNLMDRISVRKLMVLGGILLSSGYAAISLATEFWQVLVIFGVLVAPANVLIGPVAVTVLIARWFSELRGRATGFAIAGIAAGGFVFPMIIQGLLDANDWRIALRMLAVLLVFWTVPAALSVIDHPSQRGLHPDGAAQPSERTRVEQAQEPISSREVLTDPAFWMIAATVAIVTAGMKGMVTNVSIFAGCGFISKMFFAALADRVGPRALMFVALGGFALGIGLLTQAHGGYWAIALGVACIGLFGGLMVPIESFIAPRVFGQRAVGRAMGLLSGVILIALLMTPPLFGLISDLTGSYSGIYWAFSGLALVALLWVPAIRLHPRDRTPPRAVPAE